MKSNRYDIISLYVCAMSRLEISQWTSDVSTMMPKAQPSFFRFQAEHSKRQSFHRLWCFALLLQGAKGHWVDEASENIWKDSTYHSVKDFWHVSWSMKRHDEMTWWCIPMREPNLIVERDWQVLNSSYEDAREFFEDIKHKIQSKCTRSFWTHAM